MSKKGTEGPKNKHLLSLKNDLYLFKEMTIKSLLLSLKYLSNQFSYLILVNFLKK
jgi:hypothetical protein